MEGFFLESCRVWAYIWAGMGPTVPAQLTHFLDPWTKDSRDAVVFLEWTAWGSAQNMGLSETLSASFHPCMPQGGLRGACVLGLPGLREVLHRESGALLPWSWRQCLPVECPRRQQHGLVWRAVFWIAYIQSINWPCMSLLLLLNYFFNINNSLLY